MAAFLDALCAVKALIPIVEGLVIEAMAWYVRRAKQETLIELVDAAALAARAQTDADRYAAADAWVTVLSKPRTSA